MTNELLRFDQNGYPVVNRFLTPENAADYGYQYQRDLNYDPEKDTESNSEILQLLRNQNYILGLPAQEDNTFATQGLYTPRSAS